MSESYELRHEWVATRREYEPRDTTQPFCSMSHTPAVNVRRRFSVRALASDSYCASSCLVFSQKNQKETCFSTLRNLRDTSREGRQWTFQIRGDSSIHLGKVRILEPITKTVVHAEANLGADKIMYDNLPTRKKTLTREQQRSGIVWLASVDGFRAE